MKKLLALLVFCLCGGIFAEGDRTDILSDPHAFPFTRAEEFDFCTEWLPSYNFYDKALIIGGPTLSMQKHLGFLIELWDEGVRFNEIVWLVSDRKLDSGFDREFYDTCDTEGEAARIMWKKAALPNEMRKVHVVFMNSVTKYPGIHIQDTVRKWVEISRRACRALFISGQPFCDFHFRLIEPCLPEEYSFEVAGKGIDPATLPPPGTIIIQE